MSNDDTVLNKDTLAYNTALFNGSQKVIKQNENTPYKGTPEDKLKILELLEKKFEKAQSLDSNVRGNKNLLYYAVFGVDYSMLLELSLKTLINNKQNKNFDVLFITDIYTLKIIRTFECLKEFNWDYCIVNQPMDGIDASIYKLYIYSYSKINNYSKILFLDTDVICKGDFVGIFDKCAKGKFEVVLSPVMRRELSHFFGARKCATLSHSLVFFTEKNKEYILKYNPPVFNAGHFYFENTKQMQEHFKNILWLMKIWPSAYFYEQSFMNHYFNLNGLASYNIINEHIAVTMTVPSVSHGIPEIFEKQHEDRHALIHFAGTPTFGRNKYHFITYYCKYFNICL